MLQKRLLADNQRLGKNECVKNNVVDIINHEVQTS